MQIILVKADPEASGVVARPGGYAAGERERADFTEARRFAFGVLKRNPKNEAANFGVGMSYLLENKLDGALPYLEAARAAQPDEPAFLNNLAILYMKKGKLDTALRYAEEVAKLAPDVPEVKETLKRVREAARR